MKRIDIDDEIYTYIAANTEHIGESASDILRRLLNIAEPARTPGVSQEKKQQPAANTKNGHVFDVLTSGDLALEKSVVGRFLLILSALYRCHTEQFARVLDIKGRDRMYFALSEQALVQSGNSTNPKQIPHSPYWVVTNNNTTKKKSMLTQVAVELGYSATDVEKIRDFV